MLSWSQGRIKEEGGWCQKGHPAIKIVICNHMGPSLGSMSPTHPQGIRGKKKKKTLLVVVFLSFVV